MCLQAASIEGAFSKSLSLYMRSLMKMASRLAKWRLSVISSRFISSSFCKSCRVVSTEWRKTSLTLRNRGLLSSMTQQLGDMLTSQSVKA